MQSAVLFFSITGDGVPDWIPVMPAGEFRPANPLDKRGPFRLTDPAAVIAASMADGGRLPIDVNHSIMVGTSQGHETPARGWIVAMEVRDGAIWARVEWTDTGRAMMTDRQYSSVSPVFLDRGGVVVKILNATLTNMPALAELKNVFTHQQEQRMDPIQLRAALGLPETADDATILARVTDNARAVAAHATQLTAIATAAGLAASAAPDAVVTALTALRSGAGEVQTMAARLVEMEGQINAMTAAQATAAATAFVDGAIKAGKPIVASRDFWLGRHRANPAETEAVINAMMSINAGGVPPGANPGGGAVALTAEVTTIAAAMGLDPKALAAERERLGKVHDGVGA